MQFSILRSSIPTTAVLLLFVGGCESPWYLAEPLADAVIQPTNPYSPAASRKDIAEKVGKPADINFFGDQAEYMGDADNFRYVHVRDMSDFWGFLGECVYTVPVSEWPMNHSMPLTLDASKWQDVTWMGADAPAGVAQNAQLRITPSFALGAPQTQPAIVPPVQNFNAQSPDTAPATGTVGAPPSTTPAATSPTTQPSSQP